MRRIQTSSYESTGWRASGISLNGAGCGVTWRALEFTHGVSARMRRPRVERLSLAPEAGSARFRRGSRSSRRMRSARGRPVRILGPGGRTRVPSTVLGSSRARTKRSGGDRAMTASAGGSEGIVPRVTRGFLDERWLTPMQIARQFGYATDKPIRKAIMSGELKATRSPCRRKLVVAESELLRWITLDLAFEPDRGTPERRVLRHVVTGPRVVGRPCRA